MNLGHSWPLVFSNQIKYDLHFIQFQFLPFQLDAEVRLTSCVLVSAIYLKRNLIFSFFGPSDWHVLVNVCPFNHVILTVDSYLLSVATVVYFICIGEVYGIDFSCADGEKNQSQRDSSTPCTHVVLTRPMLKMLFLQRAVCSSGVKDCPAASVGTVLALTVFLAEKKQFGLQSLQTPACGTSLARLYQSIHK